MVRQSVSLLFLFSDLSSCHQGSHDGQEGLWFRKFVVRNTDLTAHRKLCTVFCQPQYQIQIKALSFVHMLSVHRKKNKKNWKKESERSWLCWGGKSSLSSTKNVKMCPTEGG